VRGASASAAAMQRAMLATRPQATLPPRGGDARRSGNSVRCGHRAVTARGQFAPPSLSQVTPQPATDSSDQQMFGAE